MISTHHSSKLIHNLANTNCRNCLYYQTSYLCPGCQAAKETFEQVLKCSFPQPSMACQTHLEEQHNLLVNICMPPLVLHAI